MRQQEHIISKTDETETLNCLVRLAAGLQREITRTHPSIPVELLKEIREFQEQCQHHCPELNYQEWCKLWQTYRSLVHCKANFLNEISNFAQSYSTMAEFWADAEAQVAAKSPYTYWDTYEHGRRRQIEQILAKTYNSEAALLVNTGMSTIAVVVGMLNLCQGAKIVTGERCYFETSDYLERYLVPRGIEVIRVPVDNSLKLRQTICKIQPELAIFETVTNVPTVPALSGLSDCLALAPHTFFLIDNSVQSHLTRWFDLIYPDFERILVIESAGKYLTHESMGGVIYGSRKTVEKARDFARATGQQLQEKAFNYLCEGEIEQVKWQLSRHSRNVKAFLQEIQSYYHYFDYIRALDSGTVQRTDCQEIFNNGVGALLFVALPPPQSNDSITLAQKHRRLMDDWFKRVKALGLDIRVRAGFGWKETVARVYESSYLNQADAPSYLRISVGIEPLEVICSIAQSLRDAVLNIS